MRRRVGTPRASRTNGLGRVAGSFSDRFLRSLLLHRALEHLVEVYIHIWLSSRGAAVGRIGIRIVGHGKIVGSSDGQRVREEDDDGASMARRK